MEYTQTERLKRLWELLREDPECKACEKEMERARQRLETHTDRMSKRTHDAYWELPTCTQTFFSRALEIAAREMCFPEEK